MQKGKPTIEGLLREVFKGRICNGRMHVTYASRTDRQVHAIGQTITINVRNVDVDEVNSELPEDISIWAHCIAPNNFDARRSTIYRHYKYVIPDKNLNVDYIRKSLKEIVGIHNFKKFCYKVNQPSVIRRIYFAKIEEKDEYITLEFIASKFARGLVRNLVSMLIHVGRREVGSIDNIWNYHEKLQMAPPENLYLINAYYPLPYEVNNKGIEKVVKILTRGIHEQAVSKNYLFKEMLEDFRKMLMEIKN